MSKSLTLATVTNINQLDEGFKKVRTKLAACGLDIKLKPLVLDKIRPFFEKAKKVEFQVVADLSCVKVVLVCGSLTTALGLEVLSDGDGEKRLEIYDKLVKLGALDKAGPDKLRALLAQRTTYKSLRSFDDVARAKLLKDFQAYAKSAHVSESLDFLVAVAKKVKREEIIKEFIEVGGAQEINIPSATRQKILTGDDPVVAVPDIKLLLEHDTIPRYKQDRMGTINGKMKAIG